MSHCAQYAFVRGLSADISFRVRRLYSSLAAIIFATIIWAAPLGFEPVFVSIDFIRVPFADISFRVDRLYSSLAAIIFADIGPLLWVSNQSSLASILLEYLLLKLHFG